MIDPDANLFLRWLCTLTDEHRDALTLRCAKRLADTNRTGRGSTAVNDPSGQLGRMLFRECASSLGLSTTELRCLLHSPQRHIMQCITWLALNQIRELDVPEELITRLKIGIMNGHSSSAELPEPIRRRINDLAL